MKIFVLIPLEKISKISLFYIVLLLVLTSTLHTESQPKTQERETAMVTKIVDGDTVKVKYKDQKESIRLIGINTPGSKDRQRSMPGVKKIPDKSKEAADFMASLVKSGDMVYIEFDVQKCDKDGRLLAYIYLTNGKMLNEEIIKAGYANGMTIPPNVKYQERFFKAFRDASKNQVDFCGIE